MSPDYSKLTCTSLRATMSWRWPWTPVASGSWGHHHCCPGQEVAAAAAAEARRPPWPPRPAAARLETYWGPEKTVSSHLGWNRTSDDVNTGLSQFTRAKTRMIQMREEDWCENRFVPRLGLEWIECLMCAAANGRLTNVRNEYYSVAFHIAVNICGMLSIIISYDNAGFRD